MKLIYATDGVNGGESGSGGANVSGISKIIRDFDFDLAYGEDENDFALVTPLIQGEMLSTNGYVYVIEEGSGAEEGTEYGGIIDAIEIDTEAKEVTYSGRTWQGILAAIVIEPDAGETTRTVSGDANAIISELLQPYGYTGSIISVKASASPIEVKSYAFPKYQNVYEGLTEMLFAYGGKLIFKFDPVTQKVVISAEWAVAFNQEDDINSVEVSFTAQRVANAVNHLVCTGTSEETEYTIHLYTDAEGGVMPYASVDTPKKDADYILTDTNKQITGIREIVGVIKTDNISVVKNHTLLATQPSDWGTNFGNYYTLNSSNGNFSKVTGTSSDSYTLLTSKPSDWDANFAKYYTVDRKTVQAVDTSTYTKLTARPKGWDFTYDEYYTRTWDGTQYVYSKVSSVSDDRYVYQTSKPSNWETNYSSYYQRKVVKTKETDDKTKTVSERSTGDGYETVKKGKDNKVPTWKKNTYFTKYSSSKAPKFDNGVDKYIKNKSETVPTWSANTYYSKTSTPIAPSFQPNVYYKEELDHYAKMVENGVKELKENAQFRDYIEINDLYVFGEFDVGDIIAVSDHPTGIEVWQHITKKIVSINRQGKTIDYKVGKLIKWIASYGS